MSGNEELITRDPSGLTLKELVMRLDARMDRYETTTELRLRTLEDDQLVSRTERRTLLSVVTALRTTILVAAALGPVLAGIIAVVATAHPASGS